MTRRLLIYSQDGMGLGHLRRAFNIAQEVLARSDDWAVLMIGDSPALSLCPPLDRLDYIKLPTLVKRGKARWGTESLPMETADAVRLRASLITETFLQFQPDAVLVDHMPVGVHGELKSLLDCASRAPWRPKLFLGLRDVIDQPEVVREVWEESGAYRYLDRFDAVLVYGCRDMYDAGTAYDLTDRVRRLVYCNYVTVRAVLEPARATHSATPMLLMMGGGGADALPLAAAFVEAFPLLQQGPLQALVLTGPNMSRADQDELRARARSHPVRIGTGVRDAAPLIAGAAAVVTMAGYNSLCETLKTETSALALPRTGPSAEQRIRSRLFSERRLIRTLETDDLSPATLAGRLDELLADGVVPDPGMTPPLDGAQRAAMAIAGAVEGASHELVSEVSRA